MSKYLSALFSHSSVTVLVFAATVSAHSPSKSEPLEIKDLIQHLDLEPHVEGGYFRQTFKADHRDLVKTDAGERTTLTSIYYLLTEASPIGHFHRNRSDIVHYFHAGDPLEYTLIHPDGTLEQRVLGPDPTRGHLLQMTVKGGIWKASTFHGDPKVGYSLIGEAVAPGFEYEDMKLGHVAMLLRAFPQHEVVIQRLAYPEPKQKLDIVRLEDQEWYTAEDRAVAREIASPRNSRLTRLSIADIKIPPGVSVEEHYHKEIEEVYFVVSGEGLMTVDGVQSVLKAGESITIMPNEWHKIENLSKTETLRLHVTCSPPWSPERLYFE